MLVLMVLAAACDTQPTAKPEKAPASAASVPTKSAKSVATAPMTAPATQPTSSQPPKALTWKSPTGASWGDYLGVRLVKTLDPNGLALVKPKAGDLFFFTNSGTGWGATNPKNSVVVFDAKTKQVVAVSDLPDEYSAGYSSHSVGVSADGKWVYLPAMGGAKPPLILILHARTLKIAQVYQSLGRGHHVNNFTAPDGRELINYTDFGWNFSGSGTLFFDPNDGNKLLGGMSRADFSGHPYVISREVGDFFYATVPAPTAALREAMEGYLAKVDAKTLQVISAIPVGDPVWPEISQDGKTAWVTLGGHGKVAKIDLTTEKVVAEVATGPGSWGVRLSCDETKLYVADKGEAIGYNQLGKTMTVIDTKYNVVVNVVPVGTTTDHILLSPDCKELWATSNSEHAIYIIDAATEKVKQVLKMPNGGDTHGGTWVRYFNDGKGGVSGEVVSSLVGLRGSALKVQRQALGLDGAGMVRGNTVRVALTQEKFDPEKITLEAGKTYQLVFTYVGGTSRAQGFQSKGLKIDAVPLTSGQSHAVALTPGTAGNFEIENPVAPTWKKLAVEVKPMTARASVPQINLIAEHSKFNLPTITAKAGSTLRIVLNNKDDEPHNLYNKDLNLNIPFAQTGQTVEWDWKVPDVGGQFKAICLIHAPMQINVSVSK